MRKFKFMALAFVCFLGMNVAKAEEVSLQSVIDNSDGNIILDKDYKGDIVINSDKNITIDLNGKTIEGNLKVNGSLTINGEGNVKISNPIDVEGGKFTLNGGDIVNSTEDNGYGVLANNSGMATINGGSITSNFSALSGNNLTGAMTFKVNGDVLTAKQGPAIYMPGPISLDITGGTINGGISIRMGKINISGGVINSISSNIDAPSEYYSYQGNAWFPDALYVMGGTYNTSIKSETNVLDLNITGGTFNCKNDQGSAVAIYDFGKVSQSMTVNISDKASLNTISKTRSAYDVINLTDLGVSNIKAGFNNSEFIGKVSTNITGGTYSSSVLKYLGVNFKETKTESGYVVSSSVKVDMPSIDTSKKFDVISAGVSDENADSVFADSLKKSGLENVSMVKVSVKNLDSVSSDVSDSISAKNFKVAGYFDISIDALSADTVIGNLSELTSNVKFTVAIPEELLSVQKGYTRNFYIIRYHDGKSDVLLTTKQDNFVSFESNKFSTYALAYEDVKEVTNPATNDGILIFIGLVFISLIGILFAYKKMKALN